jgi:hypothetical protein
VADVLNSDRLPLSCYRCGRPGRRVAQILPELQDLVPTAEHLAARLAYKPRPGWLAETALKRARSLALELALELQGYCTRCAFEAVSQADFARDGCCRCGREFGGPAFGCHGCGLVAENCKCPPLYAQPEVFRG